jgi:hypothetical protein
MFEIVNSSSRTNHYTQKIIYIIMLKEFIEEIEFIHENDDLLPVRK